MIIYIFKWNAFKVIKVPGALRGWEVKILVGNLAECRTTLISVHSNQWMTKQTWTIDQWDHLSTNHQPGQAIYCFASPQFTKYFTKIIKSFRFMEPRTPMDSKRLKYMAVSRSSFCLIRLEKASIKNLLVADVSAKFPHPLFFARTLKSMVLREKIYIAWNPSKYIFLRFRTIFL